VADVDVQLAGRVEAADLVERAPEGGGLMLQVGPPVHACKRWGGVAGTVVGRQIKEGWARTLWQLLQAGPPGDSVHRG
jgi:hypothetical protein